MGGRTSGAATDLRLRGQPAATHRASQQRLGGDLAAGQALRHVKARKCRGELLAFLRYLLSLYPPWIRLAIVLDSASPHLSTKRDTRVGDWAAAKDVELAYTPTNASYLNRIEGHFAALRYFTLDGTNHASHTEQASMIRRYVTWRNQNARDQRLQES